MKKHITLAALGLLTAGVLPAAAQITLDGQITAAELGSAATGKYTSLGAFTPAHVSNAGFGNWGLLQMYGANSASKLYLALAGTVESGTNNFQIYLDLPGKTGVPAGTALPTFTATNTVFDNTDAEKGIGGTKLELEADAALAFTGQGAIQAAVFKSATSVVAQPLVTTPALPTDGTIGSPATSATTGDFAPFAGMRAAYRKPTGDITTNPGNPSGGANSTGLELEFDRTAMGLSSGAAVIRVMAAYISGDGFWSSDVIPEVTGNGNTNLGRKPDFGTKAGTQVATFNVVVTSSRKADEAVVALSVFPNPTEGRTTISYQVRNQRETVRVALTDLAGREVYSLYQGTESVGIKEVTLPRTNVAAGTYLVKVNVGERVATRRVTLL